MAERQPQNRVLVGLPARLNTAKAELKKREDLIENLKVLYGQRLMLNDSTVLDQIGELLGCPKIVLRTRFNQADCEWCRGDEDLCDGTECQK